MKKSVPIIVVFILVALAGFLAYSNLVPALPFKCVTTRDWTGLIAWLFAVSIFVERAVEVVVMILRDQEADRLVKAQADAAEAQKNLAANSTASVADLTAAQNALTTAQNVLIKYRSETKEIALLVGFTFGIFVSLAGVRAIEGLLQVSTPGFLLNVVDIVVTGAILAGGSDGIHKMADVFNNSMEMLSARAKTPQT